MAIYDYETPSGMVRAFHQCLTTTSAGVGHFEYFMGTEGSLRMSERPDITRIFREGRAPSWQAWEQAGLVTDGRNVKQRISKDARRMFLGYEPSTGGQSVATATPSGQLDPYILNAELGNKKIHQPHLENFFAAIREGVPLNCPAEIGYETEITVMKINEAIEAERKLTFEPDEFTA
jgi:hypothetical protein